MVRCINLWIWPKIGFTGEGSDIGSKYIGAGLTHMSYSLNSLKGVYIRDYTGDYTGDYYRGY